MLHKTLQDKKQLRKKAQLKNNIDRKNENQSSSSKELIKKEDYSIDSQLLKPKNLRLLEKTLKRKAEKFDCSAIYHGNELNVIANMDSDSDESSFDDLDEF